MWLSSTANTKVIMEWRPFACVFVPNTFKEFLSKHDYAAQLQQSQQASVKAFRYRPSPQDVEEQKQRLLALRRKVTLQRRLIKQKDEESSVKRQQRLERDLSFRSSRQERPLFRSNTRTPAPILSAEPRKSIRVPETSVFFSLTEIAGEGRSARPRAATGSLPSLQQSSSRR